MMSKVQDDSTSPIMPQVIISAQQLTQKIELPHQTLTIFENLNLNIYTGEQVAITGRSGSGKSTLLGIPCYSRSSQCRSTSVFVVNQLSI